MDVIKYIIENNDEEEEEIRQKLLADNYGPGQIDSFLSDAKLPFWKRGNLKVDDKRKSGYPADEILKIKSRVLILEAETGVGKTTQLPRILLDDTPNKILITQPRILVSRSIAERLAGQFGEQPGPGKTVGYITGPYKEYSKENKIWVMTEGVLNHYLINEERRKELLSSISYFILDEVHEKTLEMDLILYYLHESLKSSEYNFKLIITSATFNPKKYAKYFHDFDPVIAKIAGETAQKEVIFLPAPVPNYIETAIKIIDQIIKDPKYKDKVPNKDILIFLPTLKSIGELESLLYSKIKSSRDQDYQSIYVSKLYSGIEKVEEEIIYKKVSELITLAGIPATRRIILSTDVSETGFTFTSLGYVIDSGFVNQSYYDPYTDANMLLISEISRDTARQRWGRVGRVSNGIVFPLYTEEEYKTKMNPERKAQIFLKPLSKFTLSLLIFSETKKGPFDYSNAYLFNRPPVDAMLRSFDTLVKTGSVDRNSRITQIGRILESFRSSPQRAKVILYAMEYFCVHQAIVVVAMLEIGIEKLIDFNLCTIPCGNEYQSDFLSYYCLYETFRKNRFKPNFLQSNGFKYNTFITLEDDILTIKKSMMEEAKMPLINIELSNDKLAMGLNYAFIKAGYFTNIAVADPQNPGYYIPEFNQKIKGRINISLAYPAGYKYKSVLPKYIMYENILVRKMGPEETISYSFNTCTRLELEPYNTCLHLTRLLRSSFT